MVPLLYMMLNTIEVEVGLTTNKGSLYKEK